MDEITAATLAKLVGTDPPRIDPVTGEPENKMRVRLEVRPLLQVLPGGHTAKRVTGLGPDGQPEPQGRSNFFIVFRSEARELEMLVESATDKELEDVEREYDRRVKKWLEKEGESADINACPHSREAAFEHVMGRSMRPIVALEVLGEIDTRGKTKKAA